MSKPLTCLVITLVFCAATVHSAERTIYTWTDERGNLHMTDEPPPSNARIKEVETYQDQTPEEVESVERDLQQRAQQRQVEDLRSEVEKARREAEAAEAAAAAASERARELTREAQDYVRRFGNTPERRQQFKYKIQAKKDMALEAQEAAIEARASADQAKIRVQQVRLAAEKAAGQQSAQDEIELTLDE